MKNSDSETKTQGWGQKLPSLVGILYSEVKREYFPTEAQYVTEKDALAEAKIVAGYLERLGVRVKLYQGTPEVTAKLLRDKPEMVFNLVGSIRGQEYLASVIPGILEALDVPYTGAGILGESLDYNKFLVKELLQSHAVPVPRFQLFSSAQTVLDPRLRFPLMAKLNEIHGAVEISKGAVSYDERHLRERARFLIATYQQPVLVEEFIAGREFTAILLEGLNKKVYVGEKVFATDDPYEFATFEAQWEKTGETFTYRKYGDQPLVEQVKRAFDVLRMSDYGKFDIRFDQSGRYYFVDSNSNPAFGPKETDCALSNILDLYGIKFSEILKRLLLNTMRDAMGKEKLPIPDAGEGGVSPT
ncbi:MAG: hypothetical protein HYS86_02905 [Candidatus Chisholmbacteria bacterium]|nr:hypothetical protein [Candidatus Chisholmbacteria bacterium]